MKSLKIFFIRLIVLLLLSLSAQVQTFAYITGSPHDFSDVDMPSYWGHGPNNHGRGEICKVCHTPHNSLSAEVPLWRGNMDASATFNLYSSDTLDAAVNQPLGPSKACLTCHDGAIAVGSVSVSFACMDCHKDYSSAGINVNLTNDHPVSFKYDSPLAQKDGALRDPSSTTVASLGGKTISESMLYQGRIECSSCHDVHRTKGDSPTAPKLLLVSNSQDKLCLTCHSK